MGKQETITQISETITQEGQSYKVHYNKTRWYHKLRLVKPYKEVVFFPVVLGTLTGISEIISKIDYSEDDLKKKVMEFGVDAVLKYKKYMLRIISLAVQNNTVKPSRKLVRFLDNNLTTADLKTLVLLVLNQMNVQDFTSSIILMRGMSLINPEEIIAPEK